MCIRDRFSIEFKHVTANTLVQGQRVKGQGHNIRNRLHGFTAKSVGLSYLFNLSGGRGHGHVASNGCQAEVHKTSESTIFSNQINPEKNNCTLSSFFGLKILCFRMSCVLPPGNH